MDLCPSLKKSLAYSSPDDNCNPKDQTHEKNNLMIWNLSPKKAWRHSLSQAQRFEADFPKPAEENISAGVW